MRVLFAVTHAGFLRNFESTLALLAERGHQVHIATDRKQVSSVVDTAPIVERLTGRYPDAISIGVTGFDRRSPWYRLARATRGTLDYWRYLSPEFDDAPKLRARGRDNAPAAAVRLTDLPGMRSRVALGVLRSLVRRVEAALPVRPEVVRLFDERPLDVVVVTPLLYFGSQQVDYVREARRRGIPTALAVGSWDHLTTKGLIHERPDCVIVWNEQQRREAERLHDIPAAEVVVTGAQPYDHWFSLRPSTTRAEFAAAAGLPASRPILLYLCSSPFIAPHEVEFVRRWMQAVRASGREELRHAGILIRPHPQNAAQWTDVDVSAFGDAVVWPRGGANPIELSARHQYFDTMFHSHAVVGINTSALIESGIVGRLVFSIRADDFAQEGTLHFQHLKRGGLLQLAATLEEHVTQLARSFDDTERERERVRAFVGSFVRPHGLASPATPLVVDAVESLAGRTTAPSRVPAGTRALRAVLGMVVR